MKMWQVQRGSTGTLFVFDPQGRLLETRRNYRTRELAEFDDGEVLDHIHIHNNERQGLSSMAFFPKNLYPAPQKVIMNCVVAEQGAAFIRRGRREGSEYTYVLVLPRGEYDCLC